MTPRLDPQKTRSQAAVSVFARPQIQGHGGDVIHEWNRGAILRQVDRLEVAAATFARVDADVSKPIRRVDGQGIEALFAAGGASHPQKWPFRETETAQKRAPGSLTFLAQHADGRQCIAE